MRRFYQTDWQGILFSSFAKTSRKELAGASFYDAFYRTLFQRYSGFDALDAGWRRSKDQVADWLAESLADGARVLSVGCGLGYMERRLWCEHGTRIELHVQDFASEALRWLREVMPADRIHDAAQAGAAESGDASRYDLIYLSAVDYALPDSALVEMLAELRTQLRAGGTIVMISASFLDETTWQTLGASLRQGAKRLLEALGLYRRGQFWGWKRAKREYHRIMLAAGLAQVTDGFIETPEQRTYWVKGKAPGAA